MAIKQIEVAVCDFKHKHDRQAVERIEIDVCATHAKMFEDRQADPYECPHCHRTDFKSLGGLNKHITTQHPGKKHLEAV